MGTCTVTKNLQITEGSRADYEPLSHYHYREQHLGPYCAIYVLNGVFRTAERFGAVSAGHLTVGVIVYSMPARGCQMRNIAAGNLFSGLDRSTRLKLISKNIRTISRIIIEPRFRSLGLAVRLVRETMPLMKVPFIEALAVMGRVSPFFEKAGMTRFDPPVSASCVRLTEALASVGVEEEDLIDPQLVQHKLGELRWPAADFIEREMNKFLQGYGRRRLMQPGIDRTRFIASKLTDRPVYYLWRNPSLELRV